MEVLSCFIIFLLLVADISQSPPSWIVSHVIVQGLLKSPFCFSKVLVINMLMPTEWVSVRILRIQLNRTSKEFQSLFMLFLQRETISNRNPGLRSVYTFFKRLMSKITEINVLLLMPQTTWIVLNSFKSIWLKFVGLLVILRSIVVSDNFHIGPCDSS